MFQVFNVFNARAEDGTVFTRDLFTNGKLWAAVLGVVVLQVLAVTVDPVQAELREAVVDLYAPCVLDALATGLDFELV